MPERAGAAVRARAGAVVREESAGVRQGTARLVGHVGLNMEGARPGDSFSGEGEIVAPAQILDDPVDLVRSGCRGGL